ncbi:hypothetical protein EON63_17325 [archaeon]|nr:MAG: hypothetical protein EON63_17325 [archaeon]
MRGDIEAEDRSGEGYITPEALYKILVKRCMPLSFEDFRFIVQEVGHMVYGVWCMVFDAWYSVCLLTPTLPH